MVINEDNKALILFIFIMLNLMDLEPICLDIMVSI
jgi:hypothetical protein